MSITGAVKFLGTNYVDENCTFAFTTANTNLASYLYDRNRSSKLTSIGSTDASNEDFEITFSTSRTFNRIFIDNHNIKSGSIQYWNGSAYTDFSSAISWSANTATTNYYEFNSVSSKKIRVRGSTTMVANAQKYIGELLVCAEIGTMGTNASSVDHSFTYKVAKHQTSTGGIKRVVFGKKYTATWSFSDADSTDTTLVESLYDLVTPFYIYPCGGSGQNEHGFRLQDIFYVNVTNDFSPNIKSNILGIGCKFDLEVAEV